MIGLVEAVVVAIAFAVPGIGWALGMVVSGAISAIHAAAAGASGGQLVGAFFQGAVMAGISRGNQIIGLAMSAYGVYQAIASNDPETMAACVGGMIGGFLATGNPKGQDTSSSSGGTATAAPQEEGQVLDIYFGNDRPKKLLSDANGNFQGYQMKRLAYYATDESSCAIDSVSQNHTVIRVKNFTELNSKLAQFVYENRKFDTICIHSHGNANNIVWFDNGQKAGFWGLGQNGKWVDPPKMTYSFFAQLLNKNSKIIFLFM